MTVWLDILTVVGGLWAAFYGLHWLLELVRAPLPILRPYDPVRRAARVARIDDFRNRGHAERPHGKSSDPLRKYPVDV